MIIRCGALRAVAGQSFSATRGRSVGLGRTHCQHVRIIAWCGDGSETVASIYAQTAVVAGSHDHHDATLPGGFNCLAERILRVADADAASQRQVDDSNVVGILQRNCCLDRRDDRAIRASAVGVEGAEINQIDCRELRLRIGRRKDMPLPPMMPATCVPWPYRSYLAPLELVVAVPVKSW